MLYIAPMTEATKPGLRGEREGNRKTIARGMPVIRLHLWRLRSCASSICTRGRGCWLKHPAFPAPSVLRGTTRWQDLGRIACAESAGACLDAAILRDARRRGLLRMKSEQVAPCPHGEEARSAVSNHEAAEGTRCAPRKYGVMHAPPPGDRFERVGWGRLPIKPPRKPPFQSRRRFACSAVPRTARTAS